MGDRLFRITNGVLLGLVGLLMLLPFYYVAVVSVTDPAEYVQQKLILFPTDWSFDAYHYLISTPAFARSIGNSIFLAAVGTVLALLVSSSLAYALSKKHFVGRKPVMLVILLTILFSPGIIPQYMLIRELNLIDSLWALIIPALANGWNVLLMKNFFDSIPDELAESSFIDGCGDIRTWLYIIIPLSLPALAAFGLFYAVGFWNQYFLALIYLNDSAKWPIQVLLQSMLLSGNYTDLGSTSGYVQPPPSQMLKMASVMIASIPIIIVYPFLQKHFAKGAMVGSVKG